MRYFFNQANGEYQRDEEGVELADHNSARIVAVQYAGEVMRDHPTLIWEGQDFRVEVTDDNNLLLFTVIIVGVDAPATNLRADAARE